MPVGKNLTLKRDKIIPEKKSKDIKLSEEDKKEEKLSLKKKEKKKVAAQKKSKAKGEKVVAKKMSDDKKKVKKEKKEDKKREKETPKSKEPVLKNKELSEVPTVAEDIPVKEVVQSETIIEALEKNADTNFRVEIIPSKRKSVKKTKIELSGELTVSNSVKINNGIKNVFKDFNIFSIVLKEVDALDLSILQLLYFYKNLYEKEGKEVKISAELTNDLKELITVNGFSNLLFSSK
ncbi:MAG: hypothetical protein OEY34_09325 [Cyclobacteriaceae bacterium]|nr:hypothetical protein [Cyclobacteriaceae bacterium]